MEKYSLELFEFTKDFFVDSIAKTSLLTAAMRAAESKRSESEGRLFVDPYAELLAGPEGKELREKAIAASGDQPAIAIRTAYMDSRFRVHAQNGYRQIVMLAAGMDTRCYRLTFAEGTQVFELDRKEVLEYKQKKIGEIKAKCQKISLAVDLRNDWVRELMSAGFKKGQKTLWLVEGLLMYLEENEVEALFKRINELSSSDDVLLFDILSQALLEAPVMLAQLQFLKEIGAPWKFGVNNPEKYMEKWGWKAKATQAGEFAPKRWPFPVVPLSVENVPRGFYVEAIKK